MTKVLVKWQKSKTAYEIQEVKEELAKRLVNERDDYEYYHVDEEKNKKIKKIEEQIENNGEIEFNNFNEDLETEDKKKIKLKLKTKKIKKKVK